MSGRKEKELKRILLGTSGLGFEVANQRMANSKGAECVRGRHGEEFDRQTDRQQQLFSRGPGWRCSRKDDSVQWNHL